MMKKSCLLVVLLGCLAVSLEAYPQSNADRITTYIYSVCLEAINSNLPADDELRLACEKLGPPPVGGPSATSTGGISVGVPATAADVSAYLKRRAIEENDEDDNDKEGASASADAKLGKFGVFVNLGYLDGKRDETTLESGFDISQVGLFGGSDYRISNQWFAGGAFGVVRLKNRLYNEAGHTDTDNVSLTGFSSYFINDNLSVDGYLGLATLSYETTRRVIIYDYVNEIATAGYDGRQITAGAAGNYSYHIKSWTFYSIAKLDYNVTRIGAYSESGGAGFNLRYEKQSIESLTSTLGVQSSYVLSQSWGVVLPQARLYFVHEFLNDSRDVVSGMVLAPDTSVALTTDNPDRDYFIGAVGASAVLPEGMQPYIDFEFLYGHSYLSTWSATAGLRWEI